MQRFKKLAAISCCLCLIFLTHHLQAQKTLNLSGSAVPFLRIAPDARSGGMGDMGVATSADAGSVFWNLGKVPFSKPGIGLTATYTPWLRDITNDVSFASLGGYYTLDEDQALSIGFRYFNLGDIRFTSDGRDDLGSSRPRETGINIGYSRRLSDRLGLGLSLGYIHSALINGATGGGMDYKTGTSIAGSLGLFYDNRDDYGTGFMFGASLSNLGSKISYFKNAPQKEFIPANIGLGSTWNTVINDVHSLSFGVEVNKLLVPTLNDTTTQAIDAYQRQSVVGSWFKSFNDLPGQSGLSLGAEYWYNELFAVRAGYYTEAKDKGGRNYLTAGLGVRYSSLEFNFSYLNATGKQYNPLTNTLRFSIAFQLGDKSYTY